MSRGSDDSVPLVVEPTLLNREDCYRENAHLGYTHKDVRAAYRSLLSLQQRTLLFNYLTPPPQAIDPDAFVGSTHHLEGGFNAEITLLVRLHRGRSGKRQHTTKTNGPPSTTTGSTTNTTTQQASEKHGSHSPPPTRQPRPRTHFLSVKRLFTI